LATASALLNVMIDAARKAARGLARDFGEVTELQVSKKGPPTSSPPPTRRPSR
jgi:myo-inositol-1(or 4)-monophosphatase